MAGGRYAFLLDDDSHPYPDPASRFQPGGPHGPSEVVDAATFRTLAGALSNTTAVCTVKAPDGTISTPGVTNDSIGVYHADVTLDQVGTWYVEWQGSGTVIAAGDLNEGPGGGAWRTVEDGLVSSAAGRFTYPATLPARLIDGLFVTPDITIEKYEVVESDLARRASDHLPVLAELKI